MAQARSAPDYRDRALIWERGRYFEDFTPGGRYEHHWGRTILESDNALFTTLTLHYNPLYFNVEYAKDRGHDGLVVNPYLVFLTVFGLSVEDLSERGGAFLGADELVFRSPVRVGDTLSAVSTVLDVRASSSRPGAGIVTWHTEGFDQRKQRVIDFRRTNLVVRRGGSL